MFICMKMRIFYRRWASSYTYTDKNALCEKDVWQILNGRKYPGKNMHIYTEEYNSGVFPDLSWDNFQHPMSQHC